MNKRFKPTLSVKHMEEFDYALGAVVGAFVGDATGACLEFNQCVTEELAREALTMPGGGTLRIGAGQITDDSELAMCQIHVLKVKDPILGFPAADMLLWYRKWAASNPFDIGTTTTLALGYSNFLNLESHFEKVKHANARSKANGSLMRMTPLCVWAHKLAIDIQVKYYQLDSKLTHPNQTILDACAAYGLAVSTLIESRGNKGQALDVVKAWVEKNARKEVVQWFEDSQMDNLEGFKITQQIGFAKWGFVLAFYYLRKNSSYELAITESLRLGGDTDTNCAIVGGMIGALHGCENIPRPMVEKMIGYQFDKEAKFGYDRPKWTQPADLIDLVRELFEISKLPL